MLSNQQPVSVSLDQAPQLIVVIDTEEEFDWFSLPSTKSDSIDSIREIGLVQDIFDQYGIVPCYVIDYPIACQNDGVEQLRPILESGRCEIGAHLHPWVNPPFDEEISWENTYPGNLDSDLELAKLTALTETIERNFGQRPDIYKAGRYGVGPNTTDILEQLGYSIDLSVCSAFDYRADGGPDFSGFSAYPYWFGKQNKMLEIPLSCAFVGLAGSLSRHLYHVAGKFDFLKARGILSRLGIVDRLMLSPEGYQTNEHIKLTRFLYQQGVRVFTWNFHSPSVVPGMTMYTQTKKDVSDFLDLFRRYFDFFLNEFNGVATTPGKLKIDLEAA